MTAFNSPEKQAAVILEDARTKELGRIADAIFALGKKSAPEPEVTYQTLANECRSIANALEQVLNAPELDTFQKAKELRKLLDYIRKYQKEYSEKYDEQVRKATDDANS